MSFEQEEIISSTTSARGPMLYIKRRAGSALTMAEEGRGLDTRLSDFCLAMARRLRGNSGILQQWTRISPLRDHAWKLRNISKLEGEAGGMHWNIVEDVLNQSPATLLLLT